MERINVNIGSVAFDYADYDAEHDILYMRVGDPEPSEAEDTPEGHAIHYALGTSRVVGLTLMSPRHILEQDGRLTVTFPEAVATPSAREMAEAFAAV